MDADGNRGIGPPGRKSSEGVEMREPGAENKATAVLLYAFALPLCFIAVLSGLGWLVRVLLPSLPDSRVRILVELLAAVPVFLVFRQKLREGEKRPCSPSRLLFCLLVSGLPCWALAAWNLFSGPLQCGFGSILAAAAGAFAVSLCEELAFRGAAFTGLCSLESGKEHAPLNAALLSSCAFGLVHLFNPEPVWTETLLQVFFAFAAGLYLCGVYRFSGTLLLPVLLHGIMDTGAFLLLPGSAAPSPWIQAGFSALFLVFGWILLARPKFSGASGRNHPMNHADRQKGNAE